MLCSIPTLSAQETKESAELAAIIRKMNELGKIDPAGKDPYHKLTAEEKRIFNAFEKKRNAADLKKNGPATFGAKMLLTKAFGVDVRNKDFDWVPLTPPLTQKFIAVQNQTIYCNDIAANGNLYAIDDTTDSLIQLDANGVATTIGPLLIPAAEAAAGLSFNWTKNTMYTVTNSGTSPNAVHKLYTVNLTTGNATFLGNFGLGTQTVIWLEIDNNGNGYYADIAADKLFSLNLTAITAAEIGPLGINIQFAQDADFNRETSELYMAAYRGAAVGQGQLALVNTTTGAATVLGDWVPATTGETIEFAGFSIANSLPATYMSTEEVQDKMSLKIYPNPASDVIVIESPASMS